MSAPTRTARTHVLVNHQFDGSCLVHPVAAPRLAAHGREEDALAELTLFLREHFASSPPEAKSRLSLPAQATLLEVSVALPRDDTRRRPDPETKVTFPCVVVPARVPRDGGLPPPTSPEHDDVWVLIPVLDHAFYVERGEPLEDTVTAEVRRFVAALDLGPWEQIGLLPPREHRLEVLEIPLSDGGRAGEVEARRQRIAERARRKKALAALRPVAAPLSEQVRRRPRPPLVGRDADLATLRALLDGSERLGVLLVGPEHAGKSALVTAWAARSERPVWSTSGAQLIAGMSGLGQWQERVRDVMDAIAELDAVLYFESLDDLLAERVESGGIDFASAMRPWLDEGKVRVVAEIRADRLDAVEGRHWAFFAGLSRLRVEPLSAADTRSALARRAAHDARVTPHRPRVADQALGPLVDLAARYLPYGAFPGKAVRLYEDLRAAYDDERLQEEPCILGTRELYQVFSVSTGVPELLLRDDAPLRIADVAAALRADIIGQEEAIARLSETLGVVKAGLSPSGKPLATFLFVGPTGVGKTELARRLASYLFGSPDRMVRFDMSEFMTPDAAERLIRGTDSDDGLLTRRVREQPFCVLLLDEIEKAHPAVFDLLLQVCGEGRLSDARGRTAYFTNAILIMTSNLGAGERRTPTGFARSPTTDAAHYQRLVETSFRQEFVNRLDRVIPFRQLTRAELGEVARLGVNRLAQRSGLAEAGCTLAVSASALERLAAPDDLEAFGARALRRHLDEHLAGPLSRMTAGLGGEAKDLTLDVTLAMEPLPEREGTIAARLEVGELVFTARRQRRAQRAGEVWEHAHIASLRRAVDHDLRLGTVVELKDRIDLLVTELSLASEDVRDARIQRERAELSAEHHRLAGLWQKLVAAAEELYAFEELSVVAMFEGQPAGSMTGDAERARRALREVLPYALVALSPSRDAVTLMLEEIDEGALSAWLLPLFDELPRRGWTATAHVHGDERLPGDDWPAERRWGPPRAPKQIADHLTAPGRRRIHDLLLRVKGPYAGVFLALEAGLCRTVLEKKPEGREDDRLHVGVRVVGLCYEVSEAAWADKHLEPPPPATSNMRRRGPAARERDEVGGTVTVAGREKVVVAPEVYWRHLDEIALAQLLMFEEGVLRREDYL